MTITSSIISSYPTHFYSLFNLKDTHYFGQKLLYALGIVGSNNVKLLLGFSGLAVFYRIGIREGFQMGTLGEGNGSINLI